MRSPGQAPSSMFARCPRATSKCLWYARTPLAYPRFTSSVPERTRKLPNARDSLFSRILYDWLLDRWFLFGVASGVALSVYYTSRGNNSFVTYQLVAKEPVSPTASIFHLHPKQPSENYELYKEAWRRGIWNVEFKQPQLQIVRAYTPLPPVDEKSGKDTGDLRFLIRHDPHGEVSSWLHRMPFNADIEMRGPYLEYEITPEVQQVVFFAGGTGIATALQVAHALFEGDRGKVDDERSKGRRLHILWANRSREDCLGGIDDDPPAESLPHKSTWSNLFSKAKPKPAPPPSTQKGLMIQELEALKQRYPGRITVEYFVNAEDTWIDEPAVIRALSRFDDKVFSAPGSAPEQQRQILISGPPGFIAHLAGPKEWRNGHEEQGAVSKIVAHALSKNPHNVKVWKI
ncbi:mitochondrial peripheral inner membrane protein [Cladophialophora chaetospira]|uniref:Mitochondrial peripheral inner membrane protein n=1 Tax=Cladophialophora chaetospira TaxID=386627 RepID=A0AA38WZF9_9EURO|nr:mitochondrial peripheral inner membrane protein [Cladophialophora chaetospira]